MADNAKIFNEYLTVTADAKGAQLSSIKGASGMEYLWQKDPKYWTGGAYNLFPVIGRMQGQEYTLDGKTYAIGSHGFARDSVFRIEQESDTKMSFILEENEDTLKAFPYHFLFTISYELKDATLQIGYTVENKENKPMYYAVGGHPGFNLPLEEGKEFTDYDLTFEGDFYGEVLQTMMSERALPEKKVPYTLTNQNSIPLHHDLFDHDAVILEGTPRTVVLAAKGGTRSITVSYPTMPYVGFWHKDHTDAPYVCIEPWSALPAWDGVAEQPALRKDLFTLAAGETRTDAWTISISE